MGESTRPGDLNSPQRALRDLGPGELIANTYRIERRIASGGMGAVFLCRHEVLGDQVAVKVILDGAFEAERAAALFQREAAALRKVRDDAVVGYESTGRDAHGNLYLVMEYVDGLPLSAFLRDGRRLDPEGVVALGSRLVAGLAAAHAAGVVHRDLCPDNVLVPDEDISRAKIIDFGISKRLAPGAGTIIGGEFAGKYAYASPEQMRLFPTPVDARSDAYSLGLVLAEMADLQLDVAARDPVEVMQVRRHDAALPGDLHPDLRRRLAALLIADPARRHLDIARAWDGETAGAAAPQPEAVASAGGKDAGRQNDPTGSDNDGFLPSSAPSRSTRAPVPPPPDGRRGGLIVAAAALLAVALGVGGWLAYARLVPDQAGVAPATSPSEPTSESVAKAQDMLNKDDPLAEARSTAGSSDPVDREAALATLMKLAGGGDGEAALEIARAYDPDTPRQDALVPEANLAFARLWYRKAADLGVTEASSRLAELPE
ncbi:serine/threonine-protein kinase [uncultured Albimonas sp.]|uniref:serine/threonine-protein kinase n=1 Tax=uncultured Albimonas sp. TaxID=1331701 RepID=UPI0030EB9235|tara:strand:+ start:4524 stop:5987 length:1464 start_codon:yes stop_codon:yes gene_type:complete